MTQAYIIALSTHDYAQAVCRIAPKLIGVNFNWYEAVRGDSLVDFIRDRRNVTLRAHNHIVNDRVKRSVADLGVLNAVGCALSHYNVWQRVLEEGQSGAYVFEQDACLTQSPGPYIEDFYAKADPHLLLLGIHGPGTERKRKVRKVTGRFLQTHGYYVTNAGARRLSEHFFPIEQQVDSYIADLVCLSQRPYEGLDPLNVYVIDPSICKQKKVQTTVQLKPIESE